MGLPTLCTPLGDLVSAQNCKTFLLSALSPRIQLCNGRVFLDDSLVNVSALSGSVSLKSVLSLLFFM